VLLGAFAIWGYVEPNRKAATPLSAEASARTDLAPDGLLRPTAGATPEIRILAGTNSPAVTDERGEVWLGDRYFLGGDPEAITPRTFAFTITPSLYFRRRRGTFSYAIPLQRGNYELRLYFADAFFGENNPQDGGESSRLFDVKANGKTLLSNFDVVADAAGSNTADIKVFDDIQPAADGSLHLDFIPRRNVAFINAIEVLPIPSKKMRPIHVYAGTTNFRDRAGINWDSDRYFRGGVRLHRDEKRSQNSDPDVFTDERFGNFVYEMPVVEDGIYSVKLRFCQESLFDSQATSPEGNVFNVYMNGKTLLENFTIPTGRQFAGCPEKEFTGLSPNAQGKLIFSFVPVRGYASLSAIEVSKD
jgi:hypothetical protein